jgi:hypothetical protein
MITVNDGSPVSIVFDISGEDGAAQDIQSITVEYLNGTNVTLGTATPSFASGDVEVSVAIPFGVNALTDPQKSESRKAQLRIQLTNGAVVFKSEVYLVLAIAPEVSFMNRSYQTLQDAELVAHSMLKMSAWQVAEQKDKINALMAAFDALGRFNYCVKPQESYISDTSIPSTIFGETWIIRGINEKSSAVVATYPATFLNAIKKAQVIEANAILENQMAISDRRNDGVIEETVGESTMKWKEGKSINYGISKDTIMALYGFIEIGYRIGRS